MHNFYALYITGISDTQPIALPCIYTHTSVALAEASRMAIKLDREVCVMQFIGGASPHHFKGGASMYYRLVPVDPRDRDHIDSFGRLLSRQMGL